MMRQALAVLALLLCSITSSLAQFSVNIGINLPVYPQLVRVPGYPVYYAPGVNSNYFFYDGMYWVYADDNWYASTWYNGPWEVVAPDYVPLYVLRVPVRYYRRAPTYFRSWRADAPPRWGDHWGNTWYDNHRDWDRWNRSSVPAPAPLPVYQRQYSGDRYPRGEQQVTLQTRNYRYEPRDATVQRQYQAQRAQLPAQTPASAAPAQDRTHSTASPATQQRQQQMQQQAARPPSSAQSRQPRDVQQQQVARPPGTPSVETSAPGSPQARQQRDAQQAARPPGTPSAETIAPGSPQARQQRDAQQAARPPSGPQGRPPQAEQRAAMPPQAGNAAAQPPRAPQAAPPRGEPPQAQGGEPPARGKSGESHGNGRGPQDKQDKQDKKDNKPD